MNPDANNLEFISLIQRETNFTLPISK